MFTPTDAANYDPYGDNHLDVIQDRCAVFDQASCENGEFLIDGVGTGIDISTFYCVWVTDACVDVTSPRRRLAEAHDGPYQGYLDMQLQTDEKEYSWEVSYDPSKPIEAQEF